jgi:exonuclease V gamma subunit
VWIEHLLMQTSDGLPTTTQLVVRGTETRATLVCFNPVADPRGRLKALINLYRTSREAPVPLLGESSRLFAETFALADSDKAFSEASKQLSRQRKWSPYLAYVFGPDDPFLDPDWREAFQRAATEVYEPLFQHRSER